MKKSSFLAAISLDEGPTRVAALAAWIQSLAAGGSRQPVLVGGAAVELYTGGAFRTGDLDFVGSLGEEGESGLVAVGFRRQGRHWIHEDYQIFLEFPSAELGSGERAGVIDVGGYSVVVIGLEELIVDRLAAWQFWSSEIDAVNAFQLRHEREADLDLSRLRQLAASRDVVPALDALEQFAQRLEGQRPSPEELESWSQRTLKRMR